MGERPIVHIRLLSEDDLAAIVALHGDLFPSSRSTLLGPAFLRAMYRWFLTFYPDLALVAEAGGNCVGFAVGSLGGYGRRIARSAWRQILLGLCRRPYLTLRPGMFRLLGSYAMAFFPRRSVQPVVPKVSLASIGVDRSTQQSGIGAALLRRFEEQAKRRNASVLGLSVESTNHAARRLYQRCGWTLRSEDRQVESAYYIKHLDTVSGFNE